MKSIKDYNKIADIVNYALQRVDEEEQKVTLEFRQTQNTVDKNFEITHREMMCKYMESGDDPIGRIKAHIIRNTRLDCSLYFGSINETSQATGVSRSTVKRVFLSLQYDDSIRLLKNGVWAVNPRVMRKGTGSKYMGLLRLYNSLPKKEKKEEEEENEMVVKIHKLYKEASNG